MKKICSLSEYLKKVEWIFQHWGVEESKTYPWFRGHADVGWALTPSIYRNSMDPDNERKICRDFYLKAGSFIGDIPDNYLELTFLMQHYGLPTRLLDWTESAITALYFSVFEFKNENDGAVLVLRPAHLNQLTLGELFVPTAEHPLMERYALDRQEHWRSPKIIASKVAAVRPKRSSRRIIAQRGFFTIHGTEKEALDKQIPPDDKTHILYCISIDGQSKKRILKQLFISGVTHAVLFPEIAGLCEEIKIRYSYDFLGIKPGRG